jgi:hypothetical protein
MCYLLKGIHGVLRHCTWANVYQTIPNGNATKIPYRNTLRDYLNRMTSATCKAVYNLVDQTWTIFELMRKGQQWWALRAWCTVITWSPRIRWSNTCVVAIMPVSYPVPAQSDTRMLMGTSGTVWTASLSTNPTAVLTQAKPCWIIWGVVTSGLWTIFALAIIKASSVS